MAPVSPATLTGLRINREAIAAGDHEYENAILHTLQVLDSISASDLAKAADGDGGLLNSLDVSLDTLPYLYTLHARIKSSRDGRRLQPELQAGEWLWSRLAAFLQRCNPIEIRYAGQMWTDLIETVLLSAPQGSKDNPAVTVVVAALRHLDPTIGTLISTHCELARVLLKEGLSHQFVPLLDNNMTRLPQKSAANADGLLRCSSTCPSNVYLNIRSGFTTKLSLQDVQEFFITAALNCIAVQDWKQAMFSLEHVLCTPCTHNPNGLMVEAYKKWLLLSLLTHGKITSLPRGIHGGVMKVMRGVTKPYDGLAEAFVKPDYRKVLAEVVEASGVWSEDGNQGLVQRVLADHQRRSVTKLGQIYAALPLARVAATLGLAEQEAMQYLTRLIRDGALGARLEQAQGAGSVLRFVDDGAEGISTTSEAQLKRQLEEQMRRIQLLGEDMNDADHLLSLTKPYMDSVRRARTRKNDPGAAAEEQHELLYGPTGMESEDEDVMGDT